MESLRIRRGTKKIEVNDDGEYIELRLDDQKFVSDLFTLISDFDKKRREVAEKVKDISIEDDETNIISEGQKKIIEINFDAHKYFKHRIDEVFGADTCRKVFGDITPSIMMIAEFFEAISPFMQKYQEEETARINKYSRGRTGNV